MENSQPKHLFKAIKRTFEFESIYKNGKKVRLSNWLMVIFTDNESTSLQSGEKIQNIKTKSLDSRSDTSAKNSADKLLNCAVTQKFSAYGVAEKSESAYGITVSRKVGKAVLRNKLKRWVRNSAQLNTWPKRLTGKRAVFVFRPQGKDFYDKITFADFKAALENLR